MGVYCGDSVQFGRTLSQSGGYRPNSLRSGGLSMRRFILTVVVAAGVSWLAAAAVAHHGWGSYDAANPVTVAGPIQVLKFENPHAEIAVRGADKVWTVTLAPTSRMTSRGASANVVAVGKT